MDWNTEYHRDISFEALETLQENYIQELEASQSPKGHMLVSEPHPTFTRGISALDEECLWDSEELAKRGVQTAKVSRGGKWTFHGPGQVVLYPIVALQSLGYSSRGIKDFLCGFHRGVSDFLRELQLEPERHEDRPFGIYLNNRKIASFGIRVHRGICSHGVALYLKPSPFFEGIHACGIANERFTSLEENGVPLPWEEAARRLSDSVKKGFQRTKSC